MTESHVAETQLTESQTTEVQVSPALSTSKAGFTRTVFLPRWRPLALGAVLLVATATGSILLWRNRAGHVDPFAAAQAAVGRGDLPTARKHLADLQASGQRPSQERLIRGAILLSKGFYYPALDELEPLRGDPDLKASALTLIGQAWYHLGRQVDAQSALQEVVKLKPDSLEAHRWLASSYYDLGAIHNAMHHLQRTVELDPGDHRPHRLLGLIYKDYERYDDAVPSYQESLRLKADQPDVNEVRLEMATCLVKLRQHRDALAALALVSASAEASVLQAECQYALGETDLAKESLAAALQADSNYLEGMLLQGSMLLEEGDARGAVEVLLRTTRAHPKDYLAHLKLAQAYVHSGEKELAASEQKLSDQIREMRKEFAELHELAWDRPDDVQVRLRLATLAQALDRPDLADVWLKAAAALQPLATEHAEHRPRDSTGSKKN